MSDYTFDDFITEQKITNTELAAYAESHINLPHEFAKKYRSQVKSLQTRLESYIADHPDYDLVKMLHSGSLAKGSSLRTINDLDTAVYVKASAVENIDNSGLISWLHDRLREVYPNFDEDQLEPHEHCVTIHYKTSGLMDVDVVPVLYEGEPDNIGYLVTKDGNRVLTSISLHIDFIRKRKQSNPNSFIQVVRFAKYWSKQLKDKYKSNGDHFRFKSLMIELILCHLVDNGLDTKDYCNALAYFFSYIAKTGLKSTIFFTDYYNQNQIDSTENAVMKIYDPVNPNNNIASTYTEEQRLKIVNEAKIALNAIMTAFNATTKSEAVENWQKLFGTTFRG